MSKVGSSPAAAPTPEPGAKATRAATGSGAKPGTASHPKVSGPLSGRKIGPYRVTDQIGKGGMGVVYRAHDTALDRTVAIKILPPHLSSDDEFIKRFVREARSAARLDHPNIVQVFQAGRMVAEGATGPGPCFIAMQYFDGRQLSDLIAAEGRLEPPRALNIVRQVAEALAAAHAAGIIHRDIKSSNILVSDGDRVKVTDFGLATCIASEGKRITQTGAYLGTPEYSSPEQCEGTELDGRSDIYSLGVVLYEMLTGRVPFEAATPLKLFERIAHEAPEPISRVQPGLPKELSTLVNKMLAKRRDDRPATAEELLSAMRRVRVALGSWKRGPGTGLRRPVGARGFRTQLLAAAAVLVALGLAFAGIYRYAKGPGQAPSAGPTAPVAVPAPKPPEVVPTTPGPEVQPVADELGVAIFDLTSHLDAQDEKQLSWARTGVPDMLITELKQCSGLEVFTRDRVAEALKSIGGQDRAAAAKKLGARLMVSGSLYSVGGRLRIDLCVADTASGTVAEAVNDEGPEARIFELVSSLGRKLRASLDSLITARRGKGQPLAAVKVLGAEECLFLAMAAPGRDGAAKEGGRAPEAKAESPKAGGDRNAADVDKKFVAKEPGAAPGYAKDGYGSEQAGGGGQQEKQALGRFVLADEVRKLSEAEKDRLKAQANSPAVANSPKASPMPPAAAPGAPPPPATAPAKPAERREGGPGGGFWQPAPAETRSAEGKAKEAGGRADAETPALSGGGAAKVPAQRADRVEALRRYYTGLALLEGGDHTTALAEFVLAKSAAPEMVVIDEAIRKAKAGIDAAR
jgi:TolB-like protein/predicted Ser/Thr protein kinase